MYGTAAIALLILPAKAELLDPADLHVGSTYDVAAGSGSHPNLVGHSFSVVDVGGQTINSPIDILLAIPILNNVVPAFSLSELGGATAKLEIPNAGSPDFHLGGNVTLSTTLDATLHSIFVNNGTSDNIVKMTTASGGQNNIYADAFKPGGPSTDASNSATNYLLAYEAQHLLGCSSSACPGSLSGWEIFAIEAETGLSSKEGISFTNVNLPLGTFIAPYAESRTHDFDTAFTNAGLVTTRQTDAVPIPGALPLFIGGLTGLGVLSRWRRRSPQAHDLSSP
jgi:hypothetical protein